jgi:hypothetical protein
MLGGVAAAPPRDPVVQPAARGGPTALRRERLGASPRRSEAGQTQGSPTTSRGCCSERTVDAACSDTAEGRYLPSATGEACTAAGSISWTVA